MTGMTLSWEASLVRGRCSSLPVLPSMLHAYTSCFPCWIRCLRRRIPMWWCHAFSSAYKRLCSTPCRGLQCFLGQTGQH
jgi:hypothetical protein